MKTYKETVAEINGTEDDTEVPFGIIRETSLRRVIQHFESDRAVGIITAFRLGKKHGLPYAENVKRNKKLGHTIRQAGYCFATIKGYWEGDDTDEEEKEESLVVVGTNKDSGRLKRLLLDQRKKWDQDSVLFKAENDEDVFLYYRGGLIEKLGDVSLSGFGKGYSQLRNKGQRKFRFKSLDEAKGFWGCYSEYVKKENRGEIKKGEERQFYFSIKGKPHQTFGFKRYRGDDNSD